MPDDAVLTVLAVLHLARSATSASTMSYRLMQINNPFPVPLLA